MATSNNMQMMVPMCTFIKAGGMKTLLHNAAYATVTPVAMDPRNEDNYFVDIRFRFSTKAGRPYFNETECGMDGTVTPRKLVSKLSDESTTREATDVSGQDMEMVSDYRENQEGAAVYMPDACWISRTKALSSILEQEAREQADEEGRCLTNVSSVRGVVCAVQTNKDGAESDMDREFCFDSPTAPSTVAINGTIDKAASTPTAYANRNASKEPALNHDREHRVALSSDSIKRKESEYQIGTDQNGSVRAGVVDNNDEVPSDRNLLRSSSLNGAVTTTRRSYSRESFARASERNGTGGSRHTSVDSAKAGDKVQQKPRNNFDDPELLLIQPNPVQPPRKLKKSVQDPARALIQPKPIRPSCNPTTNVEGAEVQHSKDPDLRCGVREEVCATPSQGGVQSSTVESDNTSARSLFRRTSNLARKVIRKLSSNDKRAPREANGEGNGDPNNIDRFAKRRSWFERRRSRDDMGRRPRM